MPHQKHIIDIRTGTLVKVTFFIFGVFLIYMLREIVAILLVSVVIASAIDPAIKWFRKYHIPRVLAVLILYVSIFLAFLLAMYIIIPSFVDDIQNFFDALPALLEKVIEQLKIRFDILEFESLIPSLGGFADKADIYIREGVLGFFGATSAIFGGIFSIILIVVISFYLAVQEKGIANFLRIIIQKDYEDYAVDVWDRTQKKIGRWLQGQFILGFLVGSLVFIGLTLLGVKYALALALLSAMFELIPFFGPIMAAIPGIAIAALQDPILGLFVLALYVAVQQMENHLIYPVVVQKMIGVPPLIAIIALIIGGELAGFFGFILAIPVVVVVIELLNDYAARKHVFE
ncbi:AI-2E family transporter [Patescibacteria group bacterium]